MTIQFKLIIGLFALFALTLLAVMSYQRLQSDKASVIVDEGAGLSEQLAEAEASFIIADVPNVDSANASAALSEHAPIQLDIAKIEANMARTEALRDSLKARQAELNKTRAALESTLSGGVIDNGLDVEFISPDSLPQPMAMDAFIAQSEPTLNTLAEGNLNASAALPSVPLTIKQNLQRDTGVSPSDVDAAFNVRNIE